MTKMKRTSYEHRQHRKGLILFHRREAEGQPIAARAAAAYYFAQGAMVAGLGAILIYFFLLR